VTKKRKKEIQSPNFFSKKGEYLIKNDGRVLLSSPRAALLLLRALLAFNSIITTFSYCYIIYLLVSSLKYIHIYTRAKCASSILNDVNDDFFVVVVVAVYVFVTRSRVFTETVVDDFKKVLAFS